MTYIIFIIHRCRFAVIFNNYYNFVERYFDKCLEDFKINIILYDLKITFNSSAVSYKIHLTWLIFRCYRCCGSPRSKRTLKRQIYNITILYLRQNRILTYFVVIIYYTVVMYRYTIHGVLLRVFIIVGARHYNIFYRTRRERRRLYIMINLTWKIINVITIAPAGERPHHDLYIRVHMREGTRNT